MVASEGSWAVGDLGGAAEEGARHCQRELRSLVVLCAAARGNIHFAVRARFEESERVPVLDFADRCRRAQLRFAADVPWSARRAGRAVIEALVAGCAVISHG